VHVQALFLCHIKACSPWERELQQGCNTPPLHVCLCATLSCATFACVSVCHPFLCRLCMRVCVPPFFASPLQVCLCATLSCVTFACASVCHPFLRHLCMCLCVPPFLAPPTVCMCHLVMCNAVLLHEHKEIVQCHTCICASDGPQASSITINWQLIDDA